MLSKIRKRMAGEEGFTLIELLVVIIIIAILAAIAIPTFLGQRAKAQDAGAKSLVRNAMTASESAYVDIRDFSTITANDLKAIEPSINFVLGVATPATAPTAPAKTDSVDYKGIDASSYQVGSLSQSGKTFGVAVNKATGNSFYVGGILKSW